MTRPGRFAFRELNFVPKKGFVSVNGKTDFEGMDAYEWNFGLVFVLVGLCAELMLTAYLSYEF